MIINSTQRPWAYNQIVLDPGHHGHQAVRWYIVYTYRRLRRNGVPRTLARDAIWNVAFGMHLNHGHSTFTSPEQREYQRQLNQQEEPCKASS